MADRQYTASAYTIDFVNHSVLLVYNVKLKKWLQPGGHIKDSELEMPWDAAVRETKEETGVDIQIIGPIFHGRYQPVAVEHYTNSVGDMIDMKYLAVPVTDSKNIKDNVIWQDIFTIDFNSDITEEIREDIKTLYRQYNHTK